MKIHWTYRKQPIISFDITICGRYLDTVVWKNKNKDKYKVTCKTCLKLIEIYEKV